ncbi:MAG: D-2-hydroxyacid dehydrogenase, partial [Spirochaetia bacterium]|nr:D-2-hydroxyacid dehydrogenase [Spirochaetia bacterium]
MKKKIVILDGYTLNPGDISWDGFHSLGEVTLHERTDNASIIERIGDAEIVITNKTPLDASTIDACTSISYIGVLATGYNVVDVAHATSKGIVVTNIPTYGTTAVSQYVFALLLELAHHVGEHSRSVKNGDWKRSKDFCYWNYPLFELSGKTLGIIGLGRIGYATAKIAKGFGMNVVAYDEYQNKDLQGDVFTYLSLDDLYKVSDVISLHCPLTASTTGLINENSIKKMKQGVFIINTSRGPLINEKDAAKALEEGHLGGLAVDVLTQEPPREENPLLESPKSIVTPHIAWAPKESRSRLMDIAVTNLKSFLEGKIVNQV